jgi:hypothetical protein
MRTHDGPARRDATGGGSTAAAVRRGGGWRRGGLLGVVALAAVLVACSSDDAGFDRTDSDTGGFGDEVSDDAWDDQDAGFDEAPEAVEDGELEGSTDSEGAGPQIIRTATLTLEVADATTAADDVTLIARERGGYVAETDLERDDQGVVRGVMVLRVPSAELDAAVEALDELAVAVPVRRVEEVDVTSQVVDIRARITNLTAYEAELTELLTDVRERTSRTDDLLQVFQQVQQVRSEIDRLQAQLDSLSDRVALSTITVTLRPSASAIPVTDPTWNPSDTAREALSATADAFTAIADVVIRLVLTVLPILLVLALPLVLLGLVLRWLLRRRDTTTHDGDSEPPPPTGAPVSVASGAPRTDDGPTPEDPPDTAP